MSLEGSACRFAGQVEVILGDESMDNALKLDTISECLDDLCKYVGWHRTVSYWSTSKER